MTEKIHNFWEWIVNLSIEPLFLPHSAWLREETEKILEILQKKETRKIITIDW